MGFLDKAKDLLAQNADKVQEAAKNALDNDDKGEQQS